MRTIEASVLDPADRALTIQAPVDLARMAGCRAAGVLCEITNDDGTMARLPELVRFGFPIVSIAELARARDAHPRSVGPTRSEPAAT